MSSKIKWGGVAGVAAAALLIFSAIINQLSPIESAYDSTASYIFLAIVVLAYIGVIVALLGIDALHRGRPRYRRLGIAGR